MAAEYTNGTVQDSQRAFRGTPDSHQYVALESVEQETQRLLDAVVRGDGIVVLTAAPGAGKTVVCRHLQAELADQFEAVVLSSSEFATRRSLLQAILFELGEAYEGMTEQESRLAILNHVRQFSGDRQGVVLIVDEAHLLNPRLLEELRCLTNHAENGESLLRVVLCAQLALEELLTQPDLQALNYRITCHATLEPLSMLESAQLVAGRLKHVGRQVEGVFAPEALETICRVSDGNPRCLIQLCDHTLTLADETLDEAVSVDVVRRALRDLKQLPLQWNESTIDQLTEPEDPADQETEQLSGSDSEWPPLPSNADWESLDESPEQEVIDNESAEDDLLAWSDDVSTVEVGGNDNHLSTSEEGDCSLEGWSSFETDPETEPQCESEREPLPVIEATSSAPLQDEMPREQVAPPVESQTADLSSFVEIPVDDRYAALDQQSGCSIELPQTSEHLATEELSSSAIAKTDSSLTSTPEPLPVSQPSNSVASEIPEVVASTQPDRDETTSGTGLAEDSWDEMPFARFDVVEPQWNDDPVFDDVPSPPVTEIAVSTEPSAPQGAPAGHPPRRPYARLFSQLRRERV